MGELDGASRKLNFRLLVVLLLVLATFFASCQLDQQGDSYDRQLMGVRTKLQCTDPDGKHWTLKCDWEGASLGCWPTNHGW